MISQMSQCDVLIDDKFSHGRSQENEDQKYARYKYIIITIAILFFIHY